MRDAMVTTVTSFVRTTPLGQGEGRCTRKVRMWSVVRLDGVTSVPQIVLTQVL